MAQLGIAFFELQSLNEGMHIKHPTYIKIRNLFCHPNKKYALDESMHSPYFFAAALGDFHLMHFLRTCLISQKNTINPSNGLSVAHYAAYYGQESIFQYIAIDHCFPIDIMDGDSNTPLHLAAAQGHVTCVKELLKLGASPSTRNGEGKTPLSLATNEDVIHIMLEYIIQLPKSDPEKDTAFIASETANDTALMAAVKLNDTTRTRRLLTESTVNVNTQDLNGNTPLHEAIKNGNVPMVRELLAKTKINVNARTKRGFTALHYAIQYVYTRLADMLIAAHIEINAQNNDGNTAEQLAE